MWTILINRRCRGAGNHGNACPSCKQHTRSLYNCDMKLRSESDLWTDKVQSRGYRTRSHRNFLTLGLFTLLALLPVSESTITSMFSGGSQGSVAINHLTLSSTGEVYVAATNYLFRLTSNLTKLEEVQTGPHLDNRLCLLGYEEAPTTMTCTSHLASGSLQRTSMDNVNKLLLVNTAANKLLVCGSLYQGYCYYLPLNNIAATVDPSTSYTPFVTADTAEGSTVGIFAPGPPNPLVDKVLYVATTLTGETFVHKKFRESHVPAVSSRKVGEGEALEFVAESHEVGTFVKYRNESCYDDKVKYVTVFHSGGYTYFFAIQRQNMCSGNAAGHYISKVIQVCESDDTYTSYVEMPITCGDYNLIQDVTVVSASSTLAQLVGASTGDQVIAAVFTRSETNSDTSTSQSAVCLYSLAEFRARFKAIIDDCFRGSGSLAPHLLPELEDLKCKDSQTLTPGTNYCGNNLNENYGMYGASGPSTTPIYTVDNVKFTAIIGHNINSYTTFFIGTSVGEIKKVFFYPPRDHMMYDTIGLGSTEAVLRDMVMSADEEYFYVPTQSKVYRVQTSDCGRFTTCGTCKGQDPHCGWCTLQRSCTLKTECDNSDRPLRWLGLVAGVCSSITMVTPNNMDIDGPSGIDVTISQLPVSGSEQYRCLLGSREFPATHLGSSGVRCDQPSSDILPIIPEGQDHVEVNLQIQSVETGIIFLNTAYTFYSCNVHQDCHSCTHTTFGCRWCTYSNKCVFSSSQCSTNQPAVSSFEWCPQIIQPMSPRILIPANNNIAFTLQAKNLPTPMFNQGGFECEIQLTEPPIRIPANRNSATEVACNHHNYTLPRGADGERPSDVRVIWNGAYVIYEATTTLIYVYDCGEKVEDCSQCQSLAPEYQCSFCGGGCRYNPTCQQPSSDTCPSPVINNVHPRTGPVEGGTRVTIEGTNLGSSFGDIDSVTLAGEPCGLVNDAYVTSRTIVCISSESTGMMVKRGNINVQIGDTSATYSDFRYQNPQLESIFPSQGPLDGGTLITISGTSLNTGADIQIKLTSDATVTEAECTDIFIISAEKLRCKTSNPPHMSLPHDRTKLEVRFDGALRELSTTFRYTANPTILGITPTAAYLAGGRNITVTGTLLNVVERPMMFIKRGSWISEKTNCVVSNESLIYCPSPTIPASEIGARRRRATDDDFQIGFEMDGVRSVQNISGYFPDIGGSFDVVPNPLYENFTNWEHTYTSGPLVLKGRYLNLACDLDEIRVVIGGQPCELENLSEENLLCTPPENDPGTSFHVVITVGRSLMFAPGTLKYADLSDSGDLPLPVIIAIAVGGGFFIVIILSIITVYHRKSKEAQRKIKKMLVQLDMLESNVRNECKQAFAELQTEVSDLTSDLNMTGIPFWDYHTYSFKVLFPSHTDHPILHNPHSEFNDSKVGFEQGLQQFNQLLNSKQFLVIFIRTLEQQKNFSIRDRAVVASLLMVVLQDKMEYATEILKALLNELIDKSVEKKNPKLLFRRTESVVEKFLTNWLSLCMYDYLKKHAGRHLFILYKAIKQQTEKGPVDAITGEARYSLSEDRLLREKIEPRLLNVNLHVENGQEPVACKMMDCDTITQAKEKALDAIYMNMPFSRRPSVYDVDLEWRSGRSGHLPLQDEDVTTEMVKGWKRVNTLAHYHIPDGATMALIPKRFKNDFVRQVHGMVEITSGSSLTTLTPIITVEEGTKVWHLVKHDDNQNQSRAQKVISEIFLTRLLTTKGTMQQYIDDLFLTILKVDNQLPTAIKYLFDFLDQAARRHNIVDPEVVHTWKSNSLPLRFWVNIIKNPEFVFDIHKPHIVDSCLSVIAQTFMDSCSTSEHRLGKDSPTNKLLFAKDIPKYRKWVERYYKEVQEMVPVSDQDMNVAMTELSMHYIVDFNIGSALKELFKYATHYNYELLEALDNDPSAKKLHLAHKFDQINTAVDGGSLY